MRLSPRIAEQLEDSGNVNFLEVNMKAFPNGAARILCALGFHVIDSYHMQRETNWIDVQVCSRCGRVTFVFSAPIEDMEEED